MPSSNELGVPSPVIDDSPDVPRDFLALANAIKPMVVPRFGSTGARDAAYATAQFRVCTVGDVLYLRRGSSWVSALAGSDIDTGWLAPTMGSGWSQLSTNPVRYRITAGMCVLNGAAYNSSGVPGTSSMLTIPSNALPSNVASYQTYAHSQAIVATGLTTAVFAPGLVNLRSSGSLVCILLGGAVSGVTNAPVHGVQWAINP